MIVDFGDLPNAFIFPYLIGSYSAKMTTIIYIFLYFFIFFYTYSGPLKVIKFFIYFSADYNLAKI